MTTCTRCGSHAINPGRHGRDHETRLDLCDVCYWRTAYGRLIVYCEQLIDALEKMGINRAFLKKPERAGEDS
jgi:hypothetical protein